MGEREQQCAERRKAMTKKCDHGNWEHLQSLSPKLLSFDRPILHRNLKGEALRIYDRSQQHLEPENFAFLDPLAVTVPDSWGGHAEEVRGQASRSPAEEGL